MFGQGSTNNQEDDIFSILARNSTPARSMSFASPQKDDAGKKSPSNSRAAASMTPNYNSKTKADDKGYADDVDELLNLIEGGSGGGSKPEKKPPLPRQTSTNQNAPPTTGQQGNKFFDELADEDVIDSVYVPRARDSNTKKSISDDPSKKRGALFGVGTQSAVHPNMQTSQFDHTSHQRPMTSEVRPNVGNSEIGEINLTVSRRAGKSRTTKDRPFTASAAFDKPESQISEEKSATDEHHGNPRRSFRGNSFDNVDDGESAYMSGLVNRERTDSKKSLTNVGLSNYYNEGGLTRNTHSQNTIDDNKQDFGSRPHPAGRRDFLDNNSQVISHNSQPGSLNTIGAPGGRRNRQDDGGNRLDKFAPKAEEDVASLVRAQASPGINVVRGTNMLLTPTREASIQEGMNPRGGFFIHDTAAQDHIKETEDYYKRRLKDVEEHYEKRHEDIKKNLDEDKKKWEAKYTKEIDMLKREKEELKEDLKVQLERERDRMKEIFNLELETKDRAHKYELERQRHSLEEQNEGLKRQLEAQTRLNSLADEIRASSNKLVTLTNQLEQDKVKGGAGLGKEHELADRERKLEELEKRLKYEQNLWEPEKKRLEKLRDDLEYREAELKKTLERERSLLRKEYQRLTDLQESIKEEEIERKKKIENEKKEWEEDKTRLEKEVEEVKKEYKRKLDKLDKQKEVLEAQRKEFDAIVKKKEEELRQKQEEAEALRKKAVSQEADISRRLKSAEYKELELNREKDDVQNKLRSLEAEKQGFEREREQMKTIIQRAREEAEAAVKAKREYEAERDKYLNLKLEIDAISRSLGHERSKLNDEKTNLGSVYKPFEGLRSTYVQDSILPETKPFTMTSPAPNLVTLGKENSDPFGFRRLESLFNTAEDLARIRSSRDKALPETRKEAEGFNNGQHILYRTIKNEYNHRSLGGGSPRSSVERDLDIGTMKGSVTPGFDYNNFMDQLKRYDRKTANHQAYVEMQGEELRKNKLDSVIPETIAKLKSPGTEELGFKSPPKFKSSIAFNKFSK